LWGEPSWDPSLETVFGVNCPGGAKLSRRPKVVLESPEKERRGKSLRIGEKRPRIAKPGEAGHERHRERNACLRKNRRKAAPPNLGKIGEKMPAIRARNRA